MTEELKKYFGDPLTGIWAILAGVLLLGLVAHYQTLDWNTYWALWVTEALSFVLIAVFFYKPSQITGYGAVAGSAVWLLNQLNCWYHLTALQTNAYLALTTEAWGSFYYLTAALNAAILGFVYWKRGEASTEDSMTWGTIGLAIMGLFSGWKLYEIYREQFPVGPTYYSANLWGISILVMSLGSILYLRSTNEDNKTYGLYAATIGLAMAAFAALYYGLALTLTGSII